MIMKILLATTSNGKTNEFRSLLADETFDLTNLGELPYPPEIAETGATFAENARLKAAGYATWCGLYTIADDSGLEVSALDGRPGIYSARYAGEGTGYDIKIPALLSEMDRSGREDRSARFVCHIAFASPDGAILFEADGVCNGMILSETRG